MRWKENLHSDESSEKTGMGFQYARKIQIRIQVIRIRAEDAGQDPGDKKP